MNQSQESRNYFAKECLQTALIDLLKDKEFHQISIIELSRRAGVSRMAFYRNYNSMIDIVSDCFEKTHFGIPAGKINGKNQYLPDIIRCTFLFFRANKILMTRLVESGNTDIIMRSMEKQFSTTFYSLLSFYGFESKYEISALVGIFYKILIDWVQSGMQEPVETMVIIVYRIMTKFDVV